MRACVAQGRGGAPPRRARRLPLDTAAVGGGARRAVAAVAAAFLLVLDLLRPVPEPAADGGQVRGGALAVTLGGGWREVGRFLPGAECSCDQCQPLMGAR